MPEKKKYAFTVGELIEVLSQYDESDEVYVEHIRKGPMRPVGVEIDFGGYLTVYAPSSPELNSKGVKYE